MHKEFRINHKWKKINSVTKKVSGSQRNSSKKSCRRSKEPFQMYLTGKKGFKFKEQKTIK